MPDIAGFPYAEVEFTKTGAVHDQAQLEAAVTTAAAAAVTDVLVVSHGWNNDMTEARNLYKELLGSLRRQLDAPGSPVDGGHRFAVVGVLWPSKRFADRDLIASGAASTGGPLQLSDLAEHIDDLAGVFTAPDADERLAQAKALLDELDDRAEAREAFANLLRGLVPPEAADDEDTPRQLFDLPGQDVLDRLGAPVLPGPPVRSTGPAGGAAGGAAGGVAGGAAGGVAGGAAGLGQFFTGVRGAARNLLNLVTYYQMKERAGTVGTGGVHALLRRLRDDRADLRLHLVGHSFGGRLVTAAVAGPTDAPPLPVDSLALLQAAFSHYGFAQDFEPGRHGFFRQVVAGGRVRGPVVITHTRNDRAVGLAYPLASMLAGQVASALGDRNDRYGAIGSNGAVKTPEAVDLTLLAAGQPYTLAPGQVCNLHADAFISGHSDVTGDEVAWALLAAAASDV